MKLGPFEVSTGKALSGPWGGNLDNEFFPFILYIFYVVGVPYNESCSNYLRGTVAVLDFRFHGQSKDGLKDCHTALRMWRTKVTLQNVLGIWYN